MTLRESLVGDARRVHEQIDTLLDSQDGLLLLFDGARMVRTAIEYRAGGGAAILPPIVDGVAEESPDRRKGRAAEQALDQVLADSFPASDPPSWNPGIALLASAGGLERQAERSLFGWLFGVSVR